MADRRINLTMDIATYGFRRNILLNQAKATLATAKGSDTIEVVVGMLNDVVKLDKQRDEMRAELDALEDTANPIPAAYR